MKGITIFTEGTSSYSYIKLLSILHRVLKSDPLWHFFDENEQGLEIRGADETIDQVARFIDATNDKFDEKQFLYHVYAYLDNNKCVQIFSEYFMQIFHLQSELAIQLYNDVMSKDQDNDEDMDYVDELYNKFVPSIIEREEHSLFNKLMWMNTKFVQRSKELFRDSTHAEAYLLADLLVDRASYCGKRAYYLAINGRDNVTKEKQKYLGIIE
jgi:hypothetical protein